MKILFDISNLLNSTGGGIHYSLKGLLPALLREVDCKKSEIEFMNFYFKNKPKDIPKFIQYEKLYDFRFPVKLLNRLWLNFNFPDLNRFYKGIDIFHSPHFSLPVFKSAKKVLTVHDITYLRHPEFFDPAYKRLNDYGYKQLLPVNLKRADHIIAISEYTKKDLIDYFKISPEKITTVYTGVDMPDKVDSIFADIYLNRNNLNSGEYIYFPVGTLEPRKNIPLTVEAFKKSNIPDNMKLVISGVGKTDWLDIEEDDRIKLIKWGSIEERDVLYQRSSFIVYPSLYEGFGMPVIEAMSNGKAVLTSNTTSLGEIAGQWANKVDPNSLMELTEGFNQLLDPYVKELFEEKSKERVKAFSWGKMASETYNIYEEILKK